MANILIVEDREDELKSYKLHLEDSGSGWNIFTARNEIEARRIIDAESIDVIITDLLMLTEQSGIEVLSAAKQKDPLVAVIIVTAFEEKLDRYQAFELGAFDSITKSTPDIKTAQEILFKTKTALRFRELALHQIESEKRIMFLKRYFDPRVFATIERNPALLNIHSQTLTICFWDIRDFSKLCETLKAHPTLISGFLREFSKTASEAIFEHHGVLDKFIGDGVMGLFGVLNQKDDKGHQDAVDAVNAAISLKTRFEELSENWMKEWKLYTPETIDIGLGCGIHTGETLVGNIGTEIRDHFTAIGPHVNFAKRIESRSGKSQILVSASTEARVCDYFELTKIDTISDVKNVPGKFDIFEVIRPKR